MNKSYKINKNSVLDQKFEYWGNQLLDTGKRNRMINFKETKRGTLKIEIPEFDELYERIVVKGEELTFRKPIDEDTDICVFNLVSLMNKVSTPLDIALGDIKTNKPNSSENKLSLRHLRSKSKLALDEQGMNILYLCFGFIEWRDHNSRTLDWIKSPLVLVPVSIDLDSVKDPFKLKKIDDDVVINPTLAYLFENDYEIKLPVLENDPDLAELHSLFKDVEDIVMNKGWKIIKECHVGLMSFLKITMYNDMIKNEEMIKKNPIIRAFAGEDEAVNALHKEMKSVDFDRIKAESVYQVIDADSSQQDAIEMSKKGNSFVLQGPPGTGKSQTITNIISEGLADGKKILFVSEKMAALEVVYKRLTDAHLADFCLPLHDHKANKKDILEKIGSNLDLSRRKVSQDEIIKLARLDLLRENLGEYAKELHTPIQPLDMTLYEVYGVLGALDELPHVPIDIDNIRNYTKTDLYKLVSVVSSFDHAKSILGEKWYKNPWQGITNNVLANNKKEELKLDLIVLSKILYEFSEYGLDKVITFNNIENYVKLGDILKTSYPIKKEWITDKSISYIDQRKHNINTIKDRVERNNVIKKELAEQYGNDFLELDSNSKINILEKNVEDLRNGLLWNYSCDQIVENLLENEKELEVLAGKIEVLFTLNNNLNEKYSMGMNNSLNELSKVLNYIHLANNADSYTSYYFDSKEIEQLETQTIKMKNSFDEIQKTKEIILNNYKDIILEVDKSVVDKIELDLEECKEYINSLETNNLISKEDYLDIIEACEESLSQCINVLNDSNVSEFENRYLISVPEKLYDVRLYIDVLEKIVKHSFNVEIWNSSQKREKSKKILELSKKSSTELEKSKIELEDIIKEHGMVLSMGDLCKNDLQILTDLLSCKEEIEKISLFHEDENVLQMLDLIQEKQSEYSNELEEYRKLKREISIKYNFPDDELIDFFANNKSLVYGCKPTKEWILNKDEVRKLIETLCLKGKELQEIKSSIIKNFDRDILDIDAKAMLQRYKIEYTGLFKSFKKNYKEDSKQLTLLSKSNVRIADNMAIKTLEDVMNYKERLEEYMSFQNQVNSKLNIDSYNIEFDWDKELKYYSFFEKIIEKVSIPSKLVELFDKNTMISFTDVCVYLDELNNWFNTNTVAENYFGSLYCKEKTNCEDIRTRLKSVKSWNVYFENNQRMIEFVTNYEEVFKTCLTLIKNILEQRKWFTDNKQNIKNCTDIEYVEGFKQWNFTEELLSIYEEVVSLFGDESANLLLKEENKNEICNYKNEINKLLNLEFIFARLNGLNQEEIDIEYYELKGLLEDLHDKVARLKTVTDNYKVIDDYRICNTDGININNIIQEIKIISKYINNVNYVKNTSGSFSEKIGALYQSENTDWNRIENNLKNAKNMCSIKSTVSESIKEAVLSGKKIIDGEQLDNYCRILDLVLTHNLIVGEFTDLSVESLLNVIYDSEQKVSCIKSEVDFITRNTIEIVSYSKLIEDLNKLSKLNASIQKNKELLESEQMILDTFNISESCDWELCIDSLNKIIKMKKMYDTQIVNNESVILLTEDVEKKEKFIKLLNSYIFNRSKLKQFLDMYDKNMCLEDKSFEYIGKKVDLCIESFDSMDQWIDFRNCRKQCEANGLKDFILNSEDYELFIQGKLDDVFKKSFYYAWLQATIDEFEVISGFVARSHDEKINEFRNLDKHQMPVAQMRIREKLLQKMPTRDSNSSKGEMAVLMHELSKKKRIIPLRKLFKKIPNLLLELKPCLMMSPLSVSYFLESEIYNFDMVIFDEASQIFPQDAIGAIARGKQVIIAGDSKQLPPTNFFKSTGSASEEIDEEEDEIISDSILEEAAMYLPNRSLLWHYRSRNEDLISFSNRTIYNNNLITFPSNVISKKDTGVEYYFVEDGIYSERANIKEAEMCLELVIEHFKTNPKRSLGIIAFSEKQQSVIENLIQEYRTKHTAYERYFSEDREEPFFVKNLENVQGDERDTIIFSICYGRNARGTVNRNFGPLSRQGGERRLNVAITRAKYNVKLVGSIMPEEIDLKGINSEGTKLLKDYISFALKNDIKEISNTTHEDVESEDSFVDDVAEFIRSKGYEVETGVGSSDYKVDIAIKNPANQNEYLVGIECDGLSYVSAKSVRDRDHLRSSVLEKMGWKLYRVWSTEWIKNPKTEQAKLLDFLKSIRVNPNPVIKRSAKGDFVETEYVRQTKNRVDYLSNVIEYENYKWPKTRVNMNYNDRISYYAQEIIRIEGPIHKDFLYASLLRLFPAQKVTQNIIDDIEYAINTNLNRRVRRDRDYYMLSEFKEVYVRKSIGEPARKVEHIYPAEIKKAIVLVCKAFYGLERKDLAQEVFKIYGFKQVGPKMKKIFDDILDKMIHEQTIKIVEDKVQLLGE